MNQPLLSVIVPCYNVEKYIDKCISSIVNQTYSDLEILLVYDSCPDNTGVICDMWQAKDHRIRVIHGKNEGVSYAYKAGVENSTARYVTFVDSDDWIHENMYLNMMSALLSTQSDIAQCGVCDAYEDGRIQHRSSENIDGSFEIVDRIKGVLLIIEDKEWKSYLCNKIFKKHLFDHIEFPKGRGLHEDASIVHILFHHALQTVYFRDEYYCYLQRIGSMTHSDHINASKMKNRYDSYNAFYERYCFVEQHQEYHCYLVYVKNLVFFHGMTLLQDSIMYPHYFPTNYSNSLVKQLQTIRFTRKDILKEFYNTKMRIKVFVFLRSPACYKWLIIILKRIKKPIRE